MFRKFSAALLCAPAASAAASSLVVDRDEFSTTTRLADGKLRTSLSSEPVNFLGEDGWEAVDTELRQGGDGTLEAKAVDGEVAIPASLGAPVELEHDGREVSFRLIGADGDLGYGDHIATYFRVNENQVGPAEDYFDAICNGLEPDDD